MSWDGVERRQRPRMTAEQTAAWFAELEAEIPDSEVIARDITRMALDELLRNIGRKPTRGTAW